MPISTIPPLSQIKLDAKELAMGGGPLQESYWEDVVPFGTSDSGSLRMGLRYLPPQPTGVLLITAHEV